MDWNYFFQLRSNLLDLDKLADFYRKWKYKELSTVDFKRIGKLTDKKEILLKIENNYLKNMEKNMEEVNINFKVQNGIKDKKMIEMCERLISEHINHLIKHKKIIKGKYYELVRGNHYELKKKVYVINVDKSFGKQNLCCVDEKYDLYRVGSAMKLGNIQKKEYFFVRGKVAYYYVR